jgi:hypothetical protein
MVDVECDENESSTRTTQLLYVLSYFLTQNQSLTMITFTRFLLFAIACINAATRGETLTTGEDVTAFVSSQISDHKV